MTLSRDSERGGVVYYCYAEDGTLLYVGQTTEPITNRLLMHGHYSSPSMRWFYYCTRVEVGPLVDNPRAAEREAIGRLRPVFNKHHNPHPTPWAPGDATKRRYRSLPVVVDLAAAPTERQSA